MKKKWIVVLVSIALLCVCAVACAETVGGSSYFQPQAMTPFGGGSDNISWTLDLDTGAMTISGAGDWVGYEWGNSFSPWNGYLEQIKSLTVEDGVQNVSSNAFANCKALKKVVLSAGVKRIDHGAFDGCVELEEINLPTGLTTIGDGAFAGCSKLKSLDLPDGMTTFQENSFTNYPGVVFTKIGSETAKAMSKAGINFRDRAYAGVMFRYSMTEEGAIKEFILAHADPSIEEVVFPEGITEIGPDAFRGCERLTSITIPATVKHIDDNAFRGCKRLTRIEIPQGITELCQGTFIDCGMLSEIILPDSLTTIGYLVFQYDTNLKRIDLPDNITTVNNEAFNEWEGICFSKIGSVTAKALSAAHHGFYDRNYPGIQLYYQFNELGDIVRFWVTWRADSVESAVIPSGVTGIAFNAFRNADKLTSITIPATVKEIGDSAFLGCNALKDVYYESSKANWEAIWIENGNDSVKNAVIHYNGDRTPEETDEPEDPDDPEEDDTGAVIDGNVYTLNNDNNTATFDGPEKTSVKTITIPATIKVNGKTYKVTAIEAYACEKLSKLTKVTIGKNVTTIGKNAFESCKKLTTVSGGAGIINIGASAFQKCAVLNAITLNTNVKSIGKNAFNGCSKLKKITIKSTLLTTKTVGSNAFKSIHKAATIVCPASKLKQYKTLMIKKGAPKSATFK